MEVSIFTKPDVSQILSRFVELWLHVDDKDPELAARFASYQDRLVNNRAQPVYAIIEPDEPEKALDKFIGADLSGARFKTFLEQYLARRG